MVRNAIFIVAVTWILPIMSNIDQDNKNHYFMGHRLHIDINCAVTNVSTR